jgi:hypothetical protein
LAASYNYIGQGPQMPWFAKPSDGVYWSDFSAIGLNLRVPIFTGFGTRAKVRDKLMWHCAPRGHKRHTVGTDLDFKMPHRLKIA